jgi:hypothetical protein
VVQEFPKLVNADLDSTNTDSQHPDAGYHRGGGGIGNTEGGEREIS